MRTAHVHSFRLAENSFRQDVVNNDFPRRARPHRVGDLLLYLSQHLIASKSNEIDQQRSVLSVEGAVQTSVNRVLSLVLDNAIWDDAVTQTYAPRLDQKWLYDTWGSGFKINNLYDGTFVLDEHYHILWGAFQSQVMPRTDLSFLGAGLTSLIRYHAKALREGKTPSPASRAPRQGSLSSASA
jgi:sensor domain CHASE-containing protein